MSAVRPLSALVHPLLVHYFLLLWLGSLSLLLVAVFLHAKRTRDAVIASWRGLSNGLDLPPAAPITPVRFGTTRRELARPENALPTPPRGEPAPSATGPDDLIAAPPTTAQGDTVRDWLKYYTHREGAWTHVVAEFYNRAARDPAIASYFVSIEMERLQQHFVATMVMVTSRGLTAGGIRAMALAHGQVRNEAGLPITGVIYDRVVATLVAVLVDFGVPDDAINELRRVVNPLRSAIVATER
jgi:truncated hemoglobin YjbI